MKKLNALTGMLLISLTVACSQEPGNLDTGVSRTVTATATSEDINAIPYELDEWKGVQGKTLADSKPDFVGQRKAEKGSPNVLVIMLDDAGYSNAGTYGGAMKTPTFDRIANEGLRYTHMSVAAVCSPTRGSLLTGHNIHTIGTGIISEFASGYPGYNSQMDYTTPSIARILKDNGYATAAFGK